MLSEKREKCVEKNHGANRGEKYDETVERKIMDYSEAPDGNNSAKVNVNSILYSPCLPWIPSYSKIKCVFKRFMKTQNLFYQ